jgi:hypothetical protein
LREALFERLSKTFSGTELLLRVAEAFDKLTMHNMLGVICLT